MASPLDQKFLGNSTDNSSLASKKPTTISNSVSSSLALLNSFSGLRDGLKFIVLGGIFETSRRLLMTGYYKFLDSFFIRATFDSDDPSYEWILIWLSKQPSWTKTRNIQITTRFSGGNSPAVVLEGEEDHFHSFYKSTRKIAYLPSASMTYSLWFKRCWMTITREQRETSGIYAAKENTLHISILTRNHRILTDLLQEARRFYMAGQEHSMCIYVSDSSNRWKHIACRSKRSQNSIVLDPGVKDNLLEDARDFLQNKSWYAERGIPFRRGYLLYGAPGSGKTSMIHCMASELMLDVYIISLSRAGMDDASLGELVNDLPERCIALMEDIDAAFTHGVSRSGILESDDEEEDPKKSKQKQFPPGAPLPPGVQPMTTPSRLSLSGLLNALDGVGAQEGRILFATTNRYSALDKALCRPGRMDLHIEFKNASKYQARELFIRFYVPTPTEDEVKEDHDAGKDFNNPGSSDEKSTLEGSPSPDVDLALFKSQTPTGRAPQLNLACIAELAERFVDAIPDRECSMASLQGYLMSYKTQPEEAVERVAEWVGEERKRRQEKENEEKEERDKSTKRRAQKCEAEEAKEPLEEEEKAQVVTLTVPVHAPAPLSSCFCRTTAACGTCGGVKVEDIMLPLPTPISKPASPNIEAE